MRKIELREDLEKRNKRNQLIVGIILVGLMLLSTAGYALLSSDRTSLPTDQNSTSGSYVTLRKDGYDFYLSSTLEAIKSVPVNISITLSNYSTQNVFVASNSTSVSSEIYNVLGRYAYRVQDACYGPCQENLPEKDCSSLLIVWSPGATNKVTQQDRCVFIEGDISSADAFLYYLLNNKV